MVEGLFDFVDFLSASKKIRETMFLEEGSTLENRKNCQLLIYIYIFFLKLDSQFSLDFLFSLKILITNPYDILHEQGKGGGMVVQRWFFALYLKNLKAIHTWKFLTFPNFLLTMHLWKKIQKCCLTHGTST